LGFKGTRAHGTPEGASMTDQTDALQLTEMLAARLCHDLSGPVGRQDQALTLATSRYG